MVEVEVYKSRLAGTIDANARVSSSAQHPITSDFLCTFTPITRLGTEEINKPCQTNVTPNTVSSGVASYTKFGHGQEQ
jgi:hypothetical protein